MIKMKLLKIKKYPEKILRQKCHPVDKIGPRDRELFESMLFTMRHFCGIGLAAPQIGIDRSMIVADIGGGEIKLANPVVVETRGSDKAIEGCLSVPGSAVEVERAYEIVVEGTNEKNETVKIKASGLLARVLQHEIDHLQGKMVIGHESDKKQ